jgi:hypothetical protein
MKVKEAVKSYRDLVKQLLAVDQEAEVDGSLGMGAYYYTVVQNTTTELKRGKKRVVKHDVQILTSMSRVAPLK